MTSSEQNYIYRPQVLVNGEPHIDLNLSDEPADWTHSYELARERGERYAANVGHGATYRVLRRPVGAWEVCSS